MPKALSLVCTLALAAATGCATAQTPPITFPAIVSPPNQERHVGKVVFAELVTPDLAAAKHFYGDLLGWTFRDYEAGNTQYAEASIAGHPVAGLVQRSYPDGKPRPVAWLTYLSVGDVDAASKTAVEKGATLLFGPRTIPDRGREAVFSDPQGAVFAALTSSSGDPADVLAAPGDWIWSSLITTDPKTAAPFYQALFGYEVFDLPAAEGAQHLLFASEDYARASVNTHNTIRPDSHSYWLNYIRVEDAVKTAAKVVALGGRVLVEPRVDRHGGMVAVVADPLGAPFGLLEWQDTETKAVSQ
jgi:predicted enzyme related to lactoylglutathione lyase